MTRRWFVAICCALLATSVMSAQSGGAKAAKSDPITGTWAGELSPENVGTVPVTMELKFDGKSAVTGTVSGLPNPANVKSGTFDQKTGALKLQLGKVSDPAVLLVLEGKVEKGTAMGTVNGDGGSGKFKIAKK